MKKKGRQGFKSTYTQHDLPQPIKSDELEVLVVRLRGGDTSVAPTIISGHMRLGMAVVTKYAHKYPYLADDLVGAAMVGICQAVTWAKERMYDNNITPYIYKTCERFVRDLIEQRLTVSIPRKTFSTLHEDEDAFVPLVVSIVGKVDEDNPPNEYDYLTELEAKTLEENPILFEELLESLALTARDKMILDMLMAKYTLEEIANYFGISKQAIAARKDAIGLKLLRRKTGETRRTKRKYLRRNSECLAVD